MSKYSFKDYIKKKCTNQLYNAVAAFILSNKSKLSVWSHSIDVDTLDSCDLNLEEFG